MPCVVMTSMLWWLPDHERRTRGLLYLFMFALGFALSEYMDALYAQILEIRDERVEHIKASSEADSKLNHVLKNRLVGATFILSQVRSALRGIEAAEESRAELKAVSAQMEVTVEWIHRREMFLQLTSGTYRTLRTAVDVCTELRRFVSGQHQMELHFRTPRVLELDVKMLAVMVEEGAGNVSGAVLEPTDACEEGGDILVPDGGCAAVGRRRSTRLRALGHPCSSLLC